jgi:hypothetical protein
MRYDRREAAGKRTARGIPQSSMIEAIKSIIKTDEWPRHHPELDADENFDDIALY